MKIIDVSRHNEIIDWEKVKSEGIDGVIIRAGFGKLVSYKDTLFETNYCRAKEVGLHIGTYWHSYASTEIEAKQEAEVFIEVIKDKKFDLPLYFDIEEKTHMNLDKKTCTAIVESFCQTVKNSGYFIGVCSLDGFFKTKLDESIQKKYSCWVIRVDGKVPQNCISYDMWLYSWENSINGIPYNAGMSECYKDFPTIIINARLNGYGNDNTYHTGTEVQTV